MSVAIGKVAFSNLTKHDFYQGKDTGNFTLTITLDPNSARELSDQGVMVKDYKDTQQRKFKSKYTVPVVDAEDNPFEGEIPYGSDVKVLYVTGPKHPEAGVPVYMNRIRVVELGGGAEAPEDF